DDRVRDWSIKTFAKTAKDVYSDFRPSGRVDIDAELSRGPGGGPIDWVAAVGCRDVAFEYKEFRYPLEHVSGKLICKPDKITVDAVLGLNPGCEITWDDLKYPVRDLTGRLEIHPTSWVFKDMRGSHGQARITGDGRVDKLGRDLYKVAIHVNASDLPFERQL